MKEGQPSQTASVVTLLRALGDIGITTAREFHDPTARPLLTGAWARLFDAVQAKAQHNKNSTLLEAAKRGADLLVLRTLLIDAYLKEELALGTKQLVILGAGLDGRAHRLPELAEVGVFEVDHPATQAYKKQHAAKLPTMSKSLTYVAVNFERDSLEAALEASGHQRSQPTIWLWEGVVMYLTDQAIRGTLRTIAARSASGSGLILNYHTPNQGGNWRNFLLRFWGEPQRAGHSPEMIAAEISAVGMQVIKDSGLQECAERFHTLTPQFGRARRARVLVARR